MIISSYYITPLILIYQCTLYNMTELLYYVVKKIDYIYGRYIIAYYKCLGIVQYSFDLKND